MLHLLDTGEDCRTSNNRWHPHNPVRVALETRSGRLERGARVDLG